MVCADNGEWDAPLYDAIDLLIVDESGQVSPELAIPSFSLAKQAILVGRRGTDRTDMVHLGRIFQY